MVRSYCRGCCVIAVAVTFDPAVVVVVVVVFFVIIRYRLRLACRFDLFPPPPPPPPTGIVTTKSLLLGHFIYKSVK